MFDTNLIFALISFYFVMYVTPGPNNAMVLASGLKFGFLKSIPHMTGITIGHVTQLILVCLGLGKIFQIFPELQNILKILCAIYLIYLGYKIIGSFSKIKDDDSRPLKFYEAALFQIVNPKAAQGEIEIGQITRAMQEINNIDIIKLPSFGKKLEAAILEMVHAFGFTI